MAGREEWSVGELASEAGVTVRALHHYDSIGLLVPSARSSRGRRRYSPGDVERLYRIVALRRLGFPLEDIRSMLEAGGGTCWRSRAGSSTTSSRTFDAGSKSTGG